MARRITQQTLLRLVNYCPTTGQFTAKQDLSQRVKAGATLGCPFSNGYIYIGLQGKHYSAHRLAFLYMTGNIPSTVDHINGNRADNSFKNLRSAATGNTHNRRLESRSTTGIKGLTWYKTVKMHGYSARVSKGYKRTSKMFGIAEYKTQEAAKEAAIKWIRQVREELHGEFANHGKDETKFGKLEA